MSWFGSTHPAELLFLCILVFAALAMRRRLAKRNPACSHDGPVEAVASRPVAPTSQQARSEPAYPDPILMRLFTRACSSPRLRRAAKSPLLHRALIHILIAVLALALLIKSVVLVLSADAWPKHKIEEKILAEIRAEGPVEWGKPSPFCTTFCERWPDEVGMRSRCFQQYGYNSLAGFPRGPEPIDYSKRRLVCEHVDLVRWWKHGVLGLL